MVVLRWWCWCKDALRHVRFPQALLCVVAELGLEHCDHSVGLNVIHLLKNGFGACNLLLLADFLAFNGSAVCFLVIGEVCFACEFLVADTAFEWLVTTMREGVRLKVTLDSKSLVALLTSKWLVARVDASVNDDVAFARKRFVASRDVTLKWTGTFVDTLVCVEIVHQSKGSCTSAARGIKICAHERLFPSVGALMAKKYSEMLELFIAVVAVKRFLFIVCLNVNFEDLSRRKNNFTDCTSDRFEWGWGAGVDTFVFLEGNKPSKLALAEWARIFARVNPLVTFEVTLT